MIDTRTGGARVADGGEYECHVEGCGETFDTSAELYLHLRDDHDGVSDP